jgi:hypothetical protein
VGANADKLYKLLTAGDRWPIKSEERIHEEIALWRALREGDRAYLRAFVDWDKDRFYYLDPLAERIPETWADLLFGDDPKIDAAEEADEARLEDIVEENDLPSSLQEAEETCSAEGEVWWRVFKDATVLTVPTIEWHSRLDVVPLYVGRKLAAAALVTEVGREESDGAGDDVVWRYVAIHEEGAMHNFLFRGADRQLGEQKPLGAHPAVADLQETWNHGLSSMLCGRVVNKRAPRNRSRSVYHGIRDYLLALNENFAIGQENARLTGKKRAVVTPDMLDSEGQFPAGSDIIIRQETDGDPDAPGDKLIQVEWQFDASALKLWVDHLEEQAVTRSRLALQLFGKGTENALTGPALRARLFDTVLAAVGKGRAWDDELPRCLMAAQMVDDLGENQGGFGRGWTSPAERPSVERGDPLPVDASDEVQRILSELQAEIVSIQTAIEERHPDWEPKRVEEEITRIFAERDRREPPAPDPFAEPGGPTIEPPVPAA